MKAQLQGFKVRELMISVLPSQRGGAAPIEGCGYCTGCTGCSGCTGCTPCSYSKWRPDDDSDWLERAGGLRAELDEALASADLVAA